MTKAYIIVCDDGVDKYAASLDSYAGAEVMYCREIVVEELRILQEEYPNNYYYIKEIVL